MDVACWVSALLGKSDSTRKYSAGRIKPAVSAPKLATREQLRERLTYNSLKELKVDSCRCYKPPADFGGRWSIQRSSRQKDTTLRHPLTNYLHAVITSAWANSLIGAGSYFTRVICAPTKLYPPVLLHVPTSVPTPVFLCRCIAAWIFV